MERHNETENGTAKKKQSIKFHKNKEDWYTNGVSDETSSET